MIPANAPYLTAYDRAKFLNGAQVFRGQCGRRRAFLSASDASAYDRGYAAYPCGPIPDVMGTPEWMGYFDAEDQDLDRLDQ